MVLKQLFFSEQLMKQEGMSESVYSLYLVCKQPINFIWKPFESL